MMTNHVNNLCSADPFCRSNPRLGRQFLRDRRQRWRVKRGCRVRDNPSGVTLGTAKGKQSGRQSPAGPAIKVWHQPQLQSDP
jgi:hypothetical protein